MYDECGYKIQMYDATHNEIKKFTRRNKWQWGSVTGVIIHVATAYSDQFQGSSTTGVRNHSLRQVLSRVDKLHLSQCNYGIV